MAEHGKREGQQLGNYRLIRLLGRAGFGEACLGEHLHLSAQVANKVLQANVADSVASSFRDDARTIAHRFHPHIVRFLDFAVKDGTLLLVMEYALNGTLRSLYPKDTCLMHENVVSYVLQLPLDL